MVEPTLESMSALIGKLERQLAAPESGLPEAMFLLVSRVTPLVNVDLLIQDDQHGTVLTWRSDRFYGPGWHVLGGIVRYKETMSERIHQVARTELGASIEFERAPLLISESILRDKRDRAHFISFLYRCRLTSALDATRKFSTHTPVSGHWCWHHRCPDNLISEQCGYATFLG